MSIVLNATEARVLGSLLEKQATTPDYYPLSLNALVNACNQKSNRDPVMELDEEEARLALRNLQEKGLAGHAAADGRVPKFEHHFQEVFNLTRRQTAVMCELLLRGAQTPGELRGRAERMQGFDDLADVQTTLQQLMAHEPALVAVLPRQPGTKEARYAHLLSGAMEAAEAAEAGTEARPPLAARVAQLEAAVAELKQLVAQLRAGN